MIVEMNKIRSLLIDIYLEAIMKDVDFEDIDLWLLRVRQDAKDIAVEIFDVFKKIKDGEKDVN